MTDTSKPAGDREPRVTRRDAEEAMRSEPVLRDSFQKFIAERGKVPNLFRVAAHRPEIARTWSEHQRAVMGTGEVPVLLKELLSVRVSQINDCEY
ncbi:MAG TPA: carboxymuconolactone decarboxylase family protein [Gemmatimonadaceae bacterium]|nr:carboxymuconolactone decarboxylase family protein [Gemmatimonadaceae bacterium]